MKLLMLIVDGDKKEEVEVLLGRAGVTGYTEIPGAVGKGATGLKLFPAELASPAVVKALLAVLPKGTALMPVGGVTPDNMDAWRAAGAAGFGIGSALYKPGKDAAAVREDALRFVAAFQRGIRA